MSLGVRHSIVLVAEIHVASLGADQFSFGHMEPPRLAIVLLIWVCRVGQFDEGSGDSDSDSESVEVESVEDLEEDWSG